MADVHRENAARIFGVDLEDVTPEQIWGARTATFGMRFGATMATGVVKVGEVYESCGMFFRLLRVEGGYRGQFLWCQVEKRRWLPGWKNRRMPKGKGAGLRRRNIFWDWPSNFWPVESGVGCG